MIQVQWDKIEQLAQTLESRNLDGDSVVQIDFVIRGREPNTRKIKFSDFRTIMWRLFDHRMEIDYVRVSLPDGECMFRYSTQDETPIEKKPAGDSSLIRFWHKRPEQERQAHMKVLWSQIASHLFPTRNGTSS